MRKIRYGVSNFTRILNMVCLFYARFGCMLFLCGGFTSAS